jgi:hypothetical protein
LESDVEYESETAGDLGSWVRTDYDTDARSGMDLDFYGRLLDLDGRSGQKSNG